MIFLPIKLNYSTVGVTGFLSLSFCMCFLSLLFLKYVGNESEHMGTGIYFGGGEEHRQVRHKNAVVLV